MENIYYTYAYLREEGTPYYIGRGKDKRAFRKHKNVAVPPKERILFLKTNLTFTESCKHESYMIFILGFKKEGGLLHNRTKGGEGSQFHFLTSLQKEKISAANLGKSKSIDHRKKISDSCKGRKKSPQHRERILQARLLMDVPPGGKLRLAEKREIARRFIPRSPGNGYGNSSELAAEFGVCRDQITRIAKDPRWTS